MSHMYFIPAFVALFVFGAFASRQIDAAKTRADEIMPMPVATTIDQIVLSEDVQHTAMVVRAASGTRNFMLDGHALTETNDEITWIGLSPDGSEWALLRLTANVPRIVLNGREQPAYDEVPRDTILWSPDGKHFAYAARRQRWWFLVLDGKEQAAGDGPPNSPMFSADSRHLVFIETKAGTKKVVADGLAGEVFTDVGDIMVSRTGYHMAYRALTTQGQTVAVVNGTKSESYSQILGLCLSNDGSRSAYVARTLPQDDKPPCFVVVVDGKPSDDFVEVTQGPVFSADGKHVAFQGASETPIVISGHHLLTGFTWLDDRVMQAKTQRIQELTFSPDGKHVAYIERVETSPFEYLSSEYQLVVDEKPFAPVADNAGAIVYSADSRRVACLFGTPHGGDRGWGVAINGVAGKSFRRVAPVIFSPDSKHVAYAAQNRNGKWFMVVDGEELAQYELFRPSSDGGPDGTWEELEKLRSARSESDPHLVSDLEPHAADFLVKQLPYHFDKTGKLHFWGVRDGILFRVQWGD